MMVDDEGVGLTIVSRSQFPGTGLTFGDGKGLGLRAAWIHAASGVYTSSCVAGVPG